MLLVEGIERPYVSFGVSFARYPICHTNAQGRLGLSPVPTNKQVTHIMVILCEIFNLTIHFVMVTFYTQLQCLHPAYSVTKYKTYCVRREKKCLFKSYDTFPVACVLDCVNGQNDIAYSKCS